MQCNETGNKNLGKPDSYRGHFGEYILGGKHFHISTLHKSLEKEHIMKSSKLNFSSGVDDNSELKF